MQNKTIRAMFGLALSLLLIGALATRSGYLRANVSERDSIAYWAAGRLLIHGQNPYETGVVLRLEQQSGYQAAKPLVLRTPPWLLFMTIPLGALDAFWAWILWIAISMGSLLLVLRMCWRMYGRADLSKNVFLLAGYTFAPIAACLVAGQMGILLLLGLTLFLWLESDYPVLAGAALLLPFAKPHLLSLFWVALLFWIVWRRQYRVAIGLAMALLAATGAALAFDPSVFRQYIEMLDQAAIGSEFIPALSGVVRLLFFRRFFWMQFVPMAVGFAWCIRFCYVNRHHWDWRDHGLAVMVVSVLTTPYSWMTDEVVLLPAMLQAVVAIATSKNKMTWKTRTIVTLFAFLNALVLLILAAKVPFSTGIYFWSSLVWFSFYVYSRRYTVRHSDPAGGPQVLGSGGQTVSFLDRASPFAP